MQAQQSVQSVPAGKQVVAFAGTDVTGGFGRGDVRGNPGREPVDPGMGPAHGRRRFTAAERIRQRGIELVLFGVLVREHQVGEQGVHLAQQG
jgi:hypothetical protein